MNDINELEFLYRKYLSSRGISTDSRADLEGKIYFALKGERFDGNKFASEAIAKGAVLAVVDDGELKDQERFFRVDNSLSTLQKLANYRRRKWDIPVLAISGSNGKTTSKELIKAVLSSRYKVFSTPGNLNNHIGLPLSIMMAPEDSEFLVLELGANHIGEHYFLCKIAMPNYGLITNNGKDHLEGYGSLDNVIRSNKELFDYLKENQGFAFVNADDPEIIKMAEGLKSESYGFESGADIGGESNDDGIFASLKYQGEVIKSKLAGNFNRLNILPAIAVGQYFGISMADIKESIESYEPRLNRSQLLTFNNFEILMDAYNANPSSMELALETLASSGRTKKMAILGGMLELGPYEKEEHQRLVDRITGLDLDRVWLIGKEFESFKDMQSIEWFENKEECKKRFQNLDFEQGIVLIKGSRKYQLEKLIQ